MAEYETKPIAPGFGVEISGLDLATGVSGNLVGDLIQIWREAGGIAVIHNQNLNSEQHIAFSRRFGPLFGDPGEEPLQDTVNRYMHPNYPEIYRVSNQVDDKGEPLGRKGAGTYWHSDVSFRERPAQASLLLGKQVPTVGGDTLFADQARAFEALSDNMKSLCSSLFAWHDFEGAARSQYANSVVVEGDMSGANRALHPVVRTNPDTSRKSLFINPGFTSHINGFTAAESEAILNFLYSHCIKPEFVYRHTWREKDLVIWDNRSVMHYAVVDYSDSEPRYMERCTVIGERPV